MKNIMLGFLAGFCVCSVLSIGIGTTLFTKYQDAETRYSMCVQERNKCLNENAKCIQEKNKCLDENAQCIAKLGEYNSAVTECLNGFKEYANYCENLVQQMREENNGETLDNLKTIATILSLL